MADALKQNISISSQLINLPPPQKHKQGFTPVHWLAANGRTALLTFLLDLGQDIDLTDKEGQTALMVACHSGHAATTTYLLDRGMRS